MLFPFCNHSLTGYSPNFRDASIYTSVFFIIFLNLSLSRYALMFALPPVVRSVKPPPFAAPETAFLMLSSTSSEAFNWTED